MIYSVLENLISYLIPVELLTNLLKTSYIKPDEKILLIALCNKLADKGSRRFELIAKKTNYI